MVTRGVVSFPVMTRRVLGAGRGSPAGRPDDPIDGYGPDTPAYEHAAFETVCVETENRLVSESR
jgi:hypothetical protein